jgi:uridine kinase
MTRRQVLHDLAQRITQINLAHPTRVAIDGVDAAGKTTFGNELAQLIEASGRKVISASVDGFHNPARVRYQRGEDSPEGYYRDSFNYPMLIEVLLAPLGPSGSRRYRSAIFDYRMDCDVDQPPAVADARSVLLVDGLFLQRPELRDYWDYTVFLDVGFELTIARAIQRNPDLSFEKVCDRYEKRYIPGQKLYLSECMPKARANIVIDNSNFSELVVKYGDKEE